MGAVQQAVRSRREVDVFANSGLFTYPADSEPHYHSFGDVFPDTWWVWAPPSLLHPLREISASSALACCRRCLFHGVWWAGVVTGSSWWEQRVWPETVKGSFMLHFRSGWSLLSVHFIRVCSRLLKDEGYRRRYFKWVDHRTRLSEMSELFEDRLF